MVVRTLASEQRCSVLYHLTGTEIEARTKADTLCLDQTVEMPADLVRTIPGGERYIGRVENFRHVHPGLSEARISYAMDIVGRSCAELLNVAFGISSLKTGIRVVHIDLPDAVLHTWSGPRFGRAGLRTRVGVSDRPLVCGVLKPLGAEPSQLAALAHQCALGGLDIVKDDQGFGDHASGPFEERVARCAEAVATANRETGRRALYVAHVTGGPTEIRRQSRQAKSAGAGGLLVCPGVNGFDVLRELAEDSQLELPLLSHPAMLGSLVVHADSGIAPEVLFGQLPRLAGADVTLYPAFDGPYTMTRDDWGRIAEATGRPWGQVKSIFPTAAGRISLDRIRELSSSYGRELVFVVGSELYRQGRDVASACREVMKKFI